MCKEYNGYPNYQTWCVSLWIDNDYGTHHHFNDLALQVLEDDTITHKTGALANRIREEIEENNPLANAASMWTDLMGHAMSSTRWWVIAENILEFVQEGNPTQ